MAAALLTFGMGAVNAGEAPSLLGATEYQAMSTSEMSSITRKGDSTIGGGVGSWRTTHVSGNQTARYPGIHGIQTGGINSGGEFRQ
jgi:hypothetical protein